MAFNPQKTLDTLIPTKQGVDDIKKKKGELDPSKEEVLGYAFTTGSLARDRVSGKIVKIIDSARGDFVIKE